ncbi:hypothetical protein L484_016597 [Morus notabilis]|uniref:Uncharacterized protein n=1 Tax=Morus notabilis TaxID=981085 RepID=W9QL61_9ROSA|nr:hypothetical protein L484_016597 [Morus notabilis]
MDFNLATPLSFIACSSLCSDSVSQMEFRHASLAAFLFSQRAGSHVPRFLFSRVRPQLVYCFPSAQSIFFHLAACVSRP